MYDYRPRGGSLELFKSRAREVLMDGPAGTGKTRAILQKIHALAEKYPGSRHLIMRQTRISMNESVLATYERIVLPEGHAALSGPDRSHRSRYTYENGSEVIVGGLDNADRVMSLEVDTAAVFEATEATEEDWEKLQTRVGRWKRMPYAQAFADCNPASPGHWLNQRALAGRIERIVCRHTDNPSLTPEYLASLSALTGTRRARLFLGQWVGSEGVVYDAWDSAIHVVNNTATPARVVLGVDDGTRNPFAALRCHIDGDGNMHVAKEVYRPGLLESGKVEAVKSLAAGAEAIYVDPAAAGLKLSLASANLPVVDANNDVLAGIARVQDRLAQRRLTIAPCCANLINEVQSYEWRASDRKDEPKKENDHALDALRYAVAAVDCVPDWGIISSVESTGGAEGPEHDEWL